MTQPRTVGSAILASTQTTQKGHRVAASALLVWYRPLERVHAVSAPQATIAVGGQLRCAIRESTAMATRPAASLVGQATVVQEERTIEYVPPALTSPALPNPLA